MRTTAAVIRLHDQAPIVLDDGPETIKFCQAEIIRSRLEHSQIAIKANLCSSTVARIAYGDVKSPRFATVCRILKVLGWRVYASR